MKEHTKRALYEFKKFWQPQTLPSAEQIYSRFIAGETILALGADYGYSQTKIESAIRFFALKASGNLYIRQLYGEWQILRFNRTQSLP